MVKNMIARIALLVSTMYGDCGSLDEIKKAIKLAMAVVDNTIEWNDKDFTMILDTVMLQIANKNA